MAQAQVAKPTTKEAPPTPIPTPATETIAPTADTVLVLVDAKGNSEINAERLGFSILREATMANGTQVLAENHYLEQGLNEVPEEVWAAIETCKLPYIQRALELGNIERLPSWEAMDLRKRIMLIDLISDASALKWLKLWKDCPNNSQAVNEKLDQKINELIGLTPDQFATLRGLLK